MRQAWNAVTAGSLTLAFALAAGAQEVPRQQPEFGEEIVVERVLLDVLVTDRKGNVVLGLDEDDFVVSEDGERITLDDVTFYSNRRFLESTERAAQVGVDADDVVFDRYFILLFHDQRMLFPRLAAQQLDAGRWVKRWVQEGVLANDYFAVVRYDSTLDVIQDFTNDPEQLTRAVDLAVQGKNPRLLEPPEQGPSLLRQLPSEQAVDRMTRTIYEGLQVLATAAGAIPARKNLILFSAGFGEVNDFGFYSRDERYYPGMVEELNANNVAVYGIDVLPMPAGQPPFFQALSNSLSDLSSDTGGEYYFHFVSFLTPLQQVAQDTNGYYLLSYRNPHPEGRSGFQTVVVDTVNPQFQVRARQGYRYGPEREPWLE
ncbi:MAG TPA: VWA domain-containing protein [Thermoanaerobaculia bacterium]|nr:VWA domain-containing protein [Thermoanaerobaculia bacterium]